MPSCALLLTTLPCKLHAPDFFLAILLSDECFERGHIDEPQAIDLAAVDEVLTREAGA